MGFSFDKNKRLKNVKFKLILLLADRISHKMVIKMKFVLSESIEVTAVKVVKPFRCPNILQTIDKPSCGG